MATDQKPTPEPTNQKPTRWDKLRGHGADQTAKARAGFAEQRGHAKARTSDWLKGGDLTDEDLRQMATEKARQLQAQRMAEAEQLVSALENRLDLARSMGKRGKTMALQVKSQLADAEEALDRVSREPDPLPTQRQVNTVRLKKRAARAGILFGGGFLALKGAATDPAVLAFLGVGGSYGWYLVSRPFADGQTPAPAPSTPQGLATPVNMTKQEAGSAPGPQVPVQREFNAPPPPSLTVDELDQALRNIDVVRPNEKIQILAVPQRDADGNTTVVFDLPPRTTVAELKKKLPKLAGALGRDVSMVDVEKAGTEVRTSFWMTDRDPFAGTRPSPLLKAPSQLDAWKDGVPVSWNKRGITIRLAINNQSFVIAGMTRSGKGVGASNLVVGAAFDPRINLRIVAGKNNGEWDPYAKTGVASTHFKPSPARLLALLQALLADKDRRERDLGALGKSKLVAQVIEQIGGIELLVIDELATYTRPGKPLREEIVDALIELSAVAAGAGIILVLITQYPEVDVLPQALGMNCGAKWAMRVENGTQSNAILGAGQASAGRDASKFDPPRPGFGWLVNPFAGVTDLARSFDLDEDERGEITMLLEKAAKIREAAGRLAGQWDDPIEKHLLNATGLSSAAGGPKQDGIPGRNILHHTPEQRTQMDALRGCLKAMTHLQRDVAQLREMTELIGGGMSETRLGELLRAAGAGGVTKVVIEGRGRVNGYARADIEDALRLLEGN